jgi:osmotically-inducible protein OsmY
MKSLALLVAAALALAACDKRPSVERIADAKPAPKAAAAPKAAEPFKSAVTGKPAPGSAQAADAQLSAKVKDALTHASEITTAGLEVASADGVVTLYGTVDAPVEKDRAAMLAMEVDGVRSVVNNLVAVKGS